MKEKNHKDAISTGSSTHPKKVIHEVPTYSARGSASRKMAEKEREALVKPYDIAHYIAVKECAFTDFEDLIELQKLHRVKFQSGSYENELGCKDFIKSIAEYFFKQDIYSKLVRVNFIAILCNGTTDTSITEREVVYVFFIDLDTMQPKLELFECLGLDSSQDATGIFDAMIAAYQKHDLSSLLQKIIFLSSDGASVNSGHKSGLVSLLHEDREWVTFIWCFSHRLELALKVGLKIYTFPVDESLMHLFYLYKNLSKKYRELKNLYRLMKGQFEMYGGGVRPTKATRTR